MRRDGTTQQRHQWSQEHLSHYVEGDLGHRARRRLDRHAEDCADCGRGIRAMRALLRLIPGINGSAGIRAPGGIFDKVRSSGTERRGDDGAPAPPQDS